MKLRWISLLLGLVLAASPMALAQEETDELRDEDGLDPETDNDTLGFEDRVVDEESTIEGAPGFVYYIVIGVLSVGLFVGLLYLTGRYRKDRGSGPR